MKKIFPLLPLLFLQSCFAQEINISNDICEFSFEKLEPCVYQINSNPIIVTIESIDIADDEKLIKQLAVDTNQNLQTLLITDNTSLLEGDIGYISFADINFDDVPDLAITTSFGTPNLYLDYWVFNVETKKYTYVGNFSEFKLDRKNRIITTKTKNSANSYTTNKWHWQENELKQI